MQKAIWTSLLRRVFPEKKSNELFDHARLQTEAITTAGKVYSEHLAQGRSPEAQFGEMERQALIRWAAACSTKTVEFRKQFSDHRLMENGDLSLGRAGAAGVLSVDIEPGVTCTIECRHPLSLVPRSWDAGHAAIAIIGVKKSGNPDENHDLWLGGALQWLAERQSKNEHAITIVQLNRGDGKRNRLEIIASPMKAQCESGKDISAWLARLLRTMLVEHCSDHLPFTVVQKLTRQSIRNPLSLNERWAKVTGSAVEEILSDDEHGYRSFLESFKLADGRRPDVDDTELRERARARFAPMIEGWIHG
jgi:hypothetical protein